MYSRLCFLVFFLIKAASHQEIEEETLVLVHALIRHGARTPDPISSFPKDLYKNLTYFPYGEGELNEEGIKTSYQLGKELGKRYEKFLGPKYRPEFLEAASSEFARCRMSMQLILAGMFPPHPSQMIQEGLSWQPIIYKYNDDKTELLLSFMPYIKFMRLIERNEENVELNKCEDRDYITKYLAVHTGIDTQSLMSLFFIYDTLKSEIENDLILPLWAESIWPEPMFTCTFDYWRHFVNNKTVLKTIGGFFMKKLLDDTNEKISQNSALEERKLFLYNAHEHNIYVLLGMLESYNNVAVNYLSYVLLEVHKIKGVFGFKVFWDNRDVRGLMQLKIPGCGQFCPVDKFYELMEIYVSKSFS